MIRSRSKTAFIFALTYGSLLTYLVFFAKRRRGVHERFNKHLLNVLPFWGKLNDISQDLKYSRLPELQNLIADFFGNIVLFIPFPICLSLVFGERDIRNTLAIGISISVLIEITQFVFGLGVADIDDVILNGIGTFLGYQLVKWVNNAQLISLSKNPGDKTI